MAAKRRRSRKKLSFQEQLIVVGGFVCAAVFLPTTVLFIAGGLPAIVAYFVDHSKRKAKAITIGAMNLAGCMPFVLELWKQGNTMETSFSIITDPMAISVMYAAAAVGYLIDWAMSGIIASFLYQRGQARKKEIKKRQQDLLDRWGREVMGHLAQKSTPDNAQEQEEEEILS